MKKTAQPIGKMIPSFQGNPTEYEFGQKVRVLIEREATIQGYTFDFESFARGRKPNHNPILIVMIDGAAYAIHTDNVLKAEDKKAA